MKNNLWMYALAATLVVGCGEEMVQNSSSAKVEGSVKNDSTNIGDEVAKDSIDSADEIDTVEVGSSLNGYASNNVRYVYKKVSKQSKIEQGDIIKFHYVLKDSKGNQIRTSKERSEPFALKQGLELMPKAIDQVLPGLYTNSKVDLIVAASHPEIEKFPDLNHLEGDSLIYTLEIMDKVKPVNTGASSVYKLELGKGAKVENGDVIGIDYFGFTPDGKVFMTSREAGASYEFPVGRGRVVAGLDSAFTKLNIGDKVIVEVPAKYAYGSKGLLDRVKPNTDLTYLITIDYKK